MGDKWKSFGVAPVFQCFVIALKISGKVCIRLKEYLGVLILEYLADCIDGYVVWKFGNGMFIGVFIAADLFCQYR